jgi:site-specific DNA-methyltransferase (adenine-specific)
MSIERKADYILEQAQILAKNVKSWADFSAAIFDQRTGLVAKTFEAPMEREAFLDSEQYEKVNQILLNLMKRFGVKGGAAPSKSGRFVVRVPKTLHSVLEIEARREGVSLNQLAVAKLSMPLQERLDISTPLVVEAYTLIYDGYSTDRVVVDPDLNARFLVMCRKLGLNESDYHLNHALLDIRKSKKAVLPKATKRTEFHDFDEYQFASEIATRILQRTRGVSLDQVLCDPKIALEFDSIAKGLVPGQSALKLRWAALNLRKTRRLGPAKKNDEMVSEAPPPVDLVPAGPLRTLRLLDVPQFPAAYVLFDQNRPIFANETENLRRRVDLHLKSGLPEWLGAKGDFDFILRHAALPGTKQEGRRSWLERYILEEKPLLNFQKVA